MHFIQIAFISVNANLRLMKLVYRSPVVIYVSTVHDSRKHEHSQHGVVHANLQIACTTLSVIRPHATLGFEEALGAMETRKDTINTTEKARVREAHLRMKSAENAEIRASGKSTLRDKSMSFSLSRKSRKSSGHAPRMISQLVYRVRCTVCLSAVFIKR